MFVCQNCDFENAPSSLFCGGCGKELGTRCDSCGKINRSQTSCDNCDHIVPRDLESGYEEQPWPKPGQLVDLVSLSFTAYKKNFKSFLILASISGIPTLIIWFMIRTLFETELASLNDLQQYTDTQLSENLMSEIKAIPIWKLFTLCFLIIIMFVTNLISGLSMVVGSAQFADAEKVSTVICLNYTLSRLWKLCLLSLFLIGLLIIPFILSLLLIGIPILVYLFVRWYFALPSLVLENTSITGSIQRSWDLVDGKWWVTLGTGTVIFILMTIPTYSLNLLLLNLNPESLNLIAEVFVSTLISPFHAIATGLYFFSLKKYAKA